MNAKLNEEQLKLRIIKYLTVTEKARNSNPQKIGEPCTLGHIVKGVVERLRGRDFNGKPWGWTMANGWPPVNPAAIKVGTLERIKIGANALATDPETLVKFCWWMYKHTSRTWTEESLGDFVFQLAGWYVLLSEIDRDWTELLAESEPKLPPPQEMLPKKRAARAAPIIPDTMRANANESLAFKPVVPVVVAGLPEQRTPDSAAFDAGLDSELADVIEVGAAETAAQDDSGAEVAQTVTGGAQ